MFPPLFSFVPMFNPCSPPLVDFCLLRPSSVSLFDGRPLHVFPPSVKRCPLLSSPFCPPLFGVTSPISSFILRGRFHAPPELRPAFFFLSAPSRRVNNPFSVISESLLLGKDGEHRQSSRASPPPLANRLWLVNSVPRHCRECFSQIHPRFSSFRPKGSGVTLSTFPRIFESALGIKSQVFLSKRSLAVWDAPQSAPPLTSNEVLLNELSTRILAPSEPS